MLIVLDFLLTLEYFNTLYGQGETLCCLISRLCKKQTVFEFVEKEGKRDFLTTLYKYNLYFKCVYTNL